MFGPITHAENQELSDLNWRERLVFAPLVILIFWMGVMPQPLLDRMQPSLDRMLDLARARTAQTAQLATPMSPRDQALARAAAEAYAARERAR
jgi:NADH:ubiquinone oxidoreductase subunit 4 (subunit M)